MSLLVPQQSSLHYDPRSVHGTARGTGQARRLPFRHPRLRSFARFGPAVLLAGTLALSPLSKPPVTCASPLPERTGLGAPEPTVTLAFVGDILLNYSVGDLIKVEGPMAPWEGVKDVLSRADISIGNLECAVGTTGEPLPGKEWTFRADPTSLDGLVGAGIDVVSLANNHTLDFGPGCLLETVELVRQKGIEPVGAGANLNEAYKPFIREINGVSVGLLAINMIYPTASWRAGEDSPGQALDDTWHRYTVEHVRDLSSQVDIVAVYVHWSEERKESPTDWAIQMATALREAGAHIIVGSHPHVLNGFDYDGQCLTAYSLGNFVFTTRPEAPKLQIGAVLEVTVSKRGVESASVVPTRIVWGRTVVMDDSPEKEETLRWLSSLSDAWQTDVDRYGNILPALFSDLRGHWAQPTVTRLVRAGAIEGYPDKTFRPGATISKGEFAALFSRTVATPQEIEGVIAPPGFTLCDTTAWQYPYMAYLASSGLIPESGPQWDPYSPCSRLDALTVMRKHAEQTVAQAVYDIPDNLERFADLAGLDAASLETASWAVEVGLLKGYEDNTLRLGGTVTRAEMAELIWRYMNTYFTRLFTAPTPASNPNTRAPTATGK